MVCAVNYYGVPCIKISWVEAQRAVDIIIQQRECELFKTYKYCTI